MKNARYLVVLVALCMIFCTVPVVHAVEPCEVHNNVLETVPPTCTEDGFMRYYCPVCGFEHSREVLPATGHKSGNWQLVSAPTGSENGEKQVFCAVCGELLDTEEVLATDPAVDIAISEPESLDEDYNTVTVTATLKNNPGVWSLVFYLYYDSEFSFVSSEPGTVYSSCEDIGSLVSDNDIVPANNITAKAVFDGAGIDTAGKHAILFYGENATMTNNTASGVLMSVTLKYSKDLEGSHKFGFAYDPESIIDSESENVDIIFANEVLDLSSAPEVHRGDVNGDGSINALDVEMLKTLLGGGSLNDVVRLNSDLDGDGSYTAMDLDLLKVLLAS